MKIDDRKVNGRITIDPQDIINAWTILVVGQTAMWITGVDKNDEPIELAAGVAGTCISSAIAAYNPVWFMVVTKTGAVRKALSSPAYSATTEKISIDIGELKEVNI